MPQKNEFNINIPIAFIFQGYLFTLNEKQKEVSLQLSKNLRRSMYSYIWDSLYKNYEKYLDRGCGESV